MLASFTKANPVISLMQDDRFTLSQRFYLLGANILQQKDMAALKVAECLQGEMQKLAPDISKIDGFVSHLSGMGANGILGAGLLLAAQISKPNVIEVFLNHKVNPNFKDRYSGATPVMVAAQVGNLGSIKLLHERGARLNDKDNEGNHSLIYILRAPNACLHLDVIKYLLNNEANPFVENKAGWSVDDFVGSLNSFYVKDLLCKAQQNYSEKKKEYTPKHLEYLAR